MNEIYKKIIEFTKKLIAIPSQNGIDSENAIAKVVFDKLASFGFEPEIIGEENHPSVICLIKKENSNKTIWLESCLDTVPAGDISKWEFPPFEGKIVGNKMFGRGANDSKIAIAIFCYLAKELAEDKKFKSSIFLGFDANEQSGEYSGIRDIVKIKKPKADICILGYQGINEISIGMRGWLRLKIITKGESAHTGSRSKRGNNAIHQMTEIITTLRRLDLEGKKEPFFEYGSNFNVSLIKGGVSINIVPDECEISIDIRFLPSQNKQEIMDKIDNSLKELKDKNPNIKYEIEFLRYELPFLTNPNDKFVKLLQKIAQDKLKTKIPIVTSGAGSVGSVITELGIPIINSFGCENDNDHAPNEWVNIESVPKVFEIYKESLKEFVAKE
ncbi:MAG: M20 family metallopeptidase [Patescibacteria group bacterium]|nr:M20 family metallopeptidase [Patescibacteria group bacterium]